ncbi:MAG: hypothetical protein GY940_31490, partial [bacterium]|nr:hypothetical protein [bacterium]
NTPNLAADYTLLNIILMLAIINYFNLIPVFPLDGGQILNTVLFSRSVRLQTFFLGFSLVAMLALGIYLYSPILLFIALVVMFSLKTHFSQRNILKKLEERERLKEDREIPEEERIAETLSIINENPATQNYSFQRKLKILQQIESTIDETKAPFKTVFFTLTIYIALFLLPIVYIVLPVLAGNPPPFLFPSYKDPCARVLELTVPTGADIEDAVSRFKRTGPPGLKPDYRTNTVFRHCFQVKTKMEQGSAFSPVPVSAPPPAPDFLARLWALWGKPDMIENGFAYTIQDQRTGVIITAYCANLTPVYLSENFRDEGVMDALYILEKKLQQTTPADCELDIHLDYSKMVEQYEQTNETGEEMETTIAHYKLGAKDGKPFLEYIEKN